MRSSTKRILHTGVRWYACLTSAWLLSCVATRSVSANDLGQTAAVEIKLLPKEVQLHYLGDRQRVLVIATMPDGSTLDVTDESTLSLDDATLVSLADNHQLTAKASGVSQLHATWRGLTNVMKVTVSDNATKRPLRFRNDVLPVLTHAGCNAGKCHGSASGKDGFRLSLYGFDPEGDHYRLTGEMSGRRVNPAKPDSCLLINKATGEVPHTGGVCFDVGSPEYRTLVTWIARGADADAADVPTPVGIDVYPKRTVMSQPGLEQPVMVVARYNDGSFRDVSDMAVYLSNNDAVASVASNGTIAATGPGSGFVMARFDQFTAGTSIVVRSGKQYPELKFQAANYVDELAATRWRDLHVQPSPVCDDETFLRRVSLDTVGKLPSIEQREAFVRDESPNKRQQLIDTLVDSDDFLSMWVMQLAELLQIRSANGLSTKGLQLYDDWLREQVHAGVTVDELLRQLIPASGSTFENPATAYYQTETTPQLLAENIAQAFLGTRIQCAQCHNHPFDRWTMDDYYGFASFVSQVGYKQARDPREITVYDLAEGNLQHPVAGRVVRPKYLGGEFADLKPGVDQREALAQWLTSSENQAFSQNIANVLWSRFMGIGIVHPVDDVRISNPPTNPALLAALGQKLTEYEFDVRELARDICNSRTYQLQTQTTDWNAWDDRNFSHAQIRRMRAEVLLDCINQVTHTSDSLAGLPLGGRAIEVPNGSSNNYFLETFGRASRNTPCSCEVSTAPTLSQALHLLNGENTGGKVESGNWIRTLVDDGKSPRDVAEAIYLACLTRKPTAAELQEIDSRLAAAPEPMEELGDLFWAVLNSNEFIFNH